MNFPVNTIKLSIVVPFRNEFALIAQMLANHLQLQRSEVEFVYVDDGSTDGSGEELLRLNPQAVILRESGVGAGKAFYSGAKKSSGTFILLLPMDCVLSASALNELVSALTLNRSRIFLYPKNYSHQEKMSTYAWVQNLVLLRGIKLAAWTNGFVLHQSLLPVLERSVRDVFLGDLELSRNIRSEAWHILKHKLSVSPRRYDQDGALRRILLNGMIVILWQLKLASIPRLYQIYKRGKNV